MAFVSNRALLQQFVWDLLQHSTQGAFEERGWLESLLQLLIRETQARSVTLRSAALGSPHFLCVCRKGRDVQTRQHGAELCPEFGYVCSNCAPKLGQPPVKPIKELEVLTFAGEALGELEVRFAEVPGTEIRELIRSSAGLAVPWLHALKLRRELEQLRHSINLGKHLGQLSHNIKNYLTQFEGSLRLLQRRRNATEEEIWGVLQRSMQKIRVMANDLMKAARPPLLDLRPIEFTALLREVVKECRPQFNLDQMRLKVDMPVERIWIMANERGMHEILLNLLLNARDALQHQHPGLGEVRIEVTTEGAMCRIEMHDNGAGISPEHIQSVFEPFFTTKQNGTGLGLAMVRRAVGEMHGRIELESQLCYGTTFRVFLPLATATDVSDAPV